MRFRSGLPLAFLLMMMPSPHAAAEEVVCRVEGGSVSVLNFPSVQPVSVQNLPDPLNVREVDSSRLYSATLDVGSGEKRPIGPFPLRGMGRAQIQVAQISPKTAGFVPLLARWYVRYGQGAAFFDPCAGEPGSIPVCTVGLPPTGARLRPSQPAENGEYLEGFYLIPTPSSIATFQVVGSEALLIVENAQSGPRTVQVTVLLDR